MSNLFVIGNAYKEKEGDIVRLGADIDNCGKKMKIFFEMSLEYENNICTEYADPFVLMALEYCMAKGIDIKTTQDMSDTLYYNLTQYFIPIFSKNTKTFHSINIYSGIKDTPVVDSDYVCTGLSGGVDSLCTILRYRNYPITKYKLTHVLFANNGAMGTSDYKESKRVFIQESKKMQLIADELNLKLINVNTNMMALYGEIEHHRANNNEGLKIASIIYAMRGLFSIYYIASTVGFDKFMFSDKDVGFFAPFTADVVSSESVRFYIGDVDIDTRIEKTEIISKSKVAMKYLTLHPNGNCGHCLKCIRTQMGLYVLNALDDFSDVFDTKIFYRRKAFLWGRNLGNRKEWLFGYNQEIIRKGIQNKKWLPLSSWLWALFFWIPAIRVREVYRKLVKNRQSNGK